MGPATRSQAVTTASGILPFKYSVIRVFVVSSVSMFYPLYWFYVSRQNASKELKTNDQVGLQTFGLIVPILNLFIIYWLCRDIALVRQKVGISTFSAKAYVLTPFLTVLAAILATAIAVASDNEVVQVVAVIPAVLLVLTYIIVFYIVWGMLINKLNEYWESRGTAVESDFSGNETLVIILGVIAPLILGFMFGFIAALADPSTYETEPYNEPSSGLVD